MICYNIDKYKNELSKIAAGQQSFSEKNRKVIPISCGFSRSELGYLSDYKYWKIIVPFYEKEAYKRTKEFFLN